MNIILATVCIQLLDFPKMRAQKFHDEVWWLISNSVVFLSNLQKDKEVNDRS